MTNTPAPLLHIEKLSVGFRNGHSLFQAVNEVSFDVYKGQTLGIVGESGSGKSVTSLALMRLLSDRNSIIRSKTIHLNGNPISALTDREMRFVRGKQIAMIFQEPMTSLNPVFRCGNQIIEAILAHENIGRKAAKIRVMELFSQVKLPRPDDIFLSYPHQLSGGQKQRVMIAMALPCKPSLLIADEPTTALDVTVQKEILQLLKEIQKSTGMGMIFITHDLGVVADIADQTAVMHRGQIVEYGTVSNVLNNPQHPYTKGLMACRPSSTIRLSRLPVVGDFLENKWPDGNGQMMRELGIHDNDRITRHENMYKETPILKVKNLQTWFPIKHGLFSQVQSHVKAVDDVSFEVYPGETLGLVGESGCGKTTLGRSILRLVEPTSGKVFFENIDVQTLNKKSLREYRKEAQIVFQDPYSSLNPGMTIGHAIMEPLQVHGLLPDYRLRKERVYELLSQVGLEASHFQRYPHEFSGGQRQRICIARALAVQPKLLVCDESVSALDVSVQAQVLNLLNHLKQTYHFTYIFISHDLNVVRYMSDRVMVMKDGKIEELAEADQLYNHPKSAYTQKLIEAIPGKNFTLNN